MDTKKEIYLEYKELFDLAEKVKKISKDILLEFNGQSIKLFSVPPHKRIFLFFLTRALKTFSAIFLLCSSGYGQDVSTLLRSLLENLISIKYIVKEPDNADSFAARFVGYKWVIFRRHLAEEERSLRNETKDKIDSFYTRKKLILENLKKFKEKYSIKSDRALLTWSGKTIKDMASAVDKKLLLEYTITFRLCSRFSHPSIISDKEYMITEENRIVFSTLPSNIGIIQNLKRAIWYVLEFLELFRSLFNLHNTKIKNLKKEYMQIVQLEKYSEAKIEKDQTQKSINKENIMVFKI